MTDRIRPSDEASSALTADPEFVLPDLPEDAERIPLTEDEMAEE